MDAWSSTKKVGSSGEGIMENQQDHVTMGCAIEKGWPRMPIKVKRFVASTLKPIVYFGLPTLIVLAVLCMHLEYPVVCVTSTFSILGYVALYIYWRQLSPDT